MNEKRSFIFAWPGSKDPSSTRKIHLRQLYDTLQLSIQRNDITEARRAWDILSRCKEVPSMEMWTTTVHLLGDDLSQEGTNERQLEFLRTMMFQYPSARESILKELVLRLISLGRYRDALDELELYLPSFPYQDDPLLHVYAGLTSLYLSQPSQALAAQSAHAGKELFDHSLFRRAQTYFERAKLLDPDSDTAHTFLEKMIELSRERRSNPLEEHDSDDDNMDIRETDRQKRVRKVP